MLKNNVFIVFALIVLNSLQQFSCATTTTTKKSTTTKYLTSTTVVTQNSSSWIIPVAVVCSILGACCITGVVVSVTCTIIEAKKMKSTKVNPIDDIDACENNVVPNKNNILNESTQNNNIGEKNDYGEIPLGSFQNEFDQKISAPPEYHSIHKLPVININIGRTENLYPVYPVLPATH